MDHSQGEDVKEDHQQLISSLPLEEGTAAVRLRNYQGFWYPEHLLRGILTFRSHFNPRPTDVFLTSQPKCGTTWLKALAFAVATRKDYPLDGHHPLLSRNPHELVPLVDAKMASSDTYKDGLDALPAPRLLNTHMPYSLLPDPVRSSGCRIVYLCRNPKDAFISSWHFNRTLSQETADSVPFAAAFDKFCKGVSPYGPIWEHNLEYWKASSERPDKVLLLKYETMREDPIESVRRLAEFLGQPFDQKEEEEGVADEIVRLCSFENLSRLQVNTMGELSGSARRIKNSSFFRKGSVGDWKNHLSTEMVQALDEILQEKLAGISGLSYSV